MDVIRLRNIGPVSTQMLNEIGVFTRQDLEEMGAVMAYKIIRHQRSGGVSLNLLYALEGALTDQHWSELLPEVKARLREEAEAPFDVSF